VTRIEDIGGEVRLSRGQPGLGPNDAAFLAMLATARRVRLDRTRTVLGGLALGLLVAAALLVPVPRPEPVVVAHDPPPVEVPRETDPMAALMLESARIRLEGLGDPAVGVARLKELTERYPGSASAREAELLLAKLEENDR